MCTKEHAKCDFGHTTFSSFQAYLRFKFWSQNGQDIIAYIRHSCNLVSHLWINWISLTNVRSLSSLDSVILSSLESYLEVSRVQVVFQPLTYHSKWRDSSSILFTILIFFLLKCLSFQVHWIWVTRSSIMNSSLENQA